MESNRWVHAVWHTSSIMVDSAHAMFFPSDAFRWQLSAYAESTGLAGRVELHTCNNCAWIWRQP